MSPERQAIAALRRLHDLVEWKLRHGWESDEEVQDVCAQALTALTAERTPPSAQDEPQPLLSEPIMALARAGRLIDAIRLVRADYGLALREAKEAVEQALRMEKLRAEAAALAAPSPPPSDRTWMTSDERAVSVAAWLAREAFTKQSAPPSDPERATLAQHLREAFDRYTPGQCKWVSLGPDCCCLKCAAALLDADAREIAALRQQIQAERTRAEQAETEHVPAMHYDGRWLCDYCGEAVSESHEYVVKHMATCASRPSER